MSRFSVRVTYDSGKPASDVGVMIDYGALGGYDEKRTDHDGWVEFNNETDDPADIWVHGRNMGSHSLSGGKTYAFTI